MSDADARVRRRAAEAQEEGWALLRRMKDDLRLVSADLLDAIRAWFAALGPCWGMSRTCVSDIGAADCDAAVKLLPVRLEAVFHGLLLCACHSRVSAVSTPGRSERRGADGAGGGHCRAVARARARERFRRVRALQCLTTTSRRRPLRYAQNVRSFVEWSARHGPFDTIIDGANVGMFNQNFQDAKFNFNQVERLLARLRSERSEDAKPVLLVLHQRRVRGGPAHAPHAQKLVQTWRSNRA